MKCQSLQTFLHDHAEISFVALQWVDYCGHLRARILTTRRAAELEKTGTSISSGLVHMTVLPDGSPLPGHPACAVEHFRPDWQSLRIFSYHEETYAAVQCNLYEEIRGQPPGSDRCPRTALANVLLRALPRTFLIGFEIEFMILNADLAAEKTAGYSSATILYTKTFHVLADCVKRLERSGIPVLAFHAEGMGNQFEIATGPMTPMDAVDALVLTLQIIRGTTAQHGYRATMHPKPFATGASNGMHANISFQPVRDENYFVAGIVNRLPLLCGFSMPIEDSYKRMNKGECGSWVAWGVQNRDVPLRKIVPGRWEIRCFDSAANPYLAIAAYIAAGLTGVDNQEQCQLKDCDQWVSHLGLDEVQPWNITTKMPRSLNESIACLKNQATSLNRYIPDRLVNRYIHLKEHQIQRLESLPENERKFVMMQAY